MRTFWSSRLVLSALGGERLTREKEKWNENEKEKLELYIFI